VLIRAKLLSPAAGKKSYKKYKKMKNNQS